MSEQHFFRHRLQAGKVSRDRDAALLRLCRSKRVAHVGCVDWPLTQERIADGSLFHPKLLEVASDVVGIDVDAAGLEQMRVAVGGDYLCVDPTDLATPNPDAEARLEGFRPEIVLVADVIEHVPQPEAFLRGIDAMARATGGIVVLTTPNALGFRNAINTLLGYELMHPDHVAIHSPMTLRTLMERSGLTVTTWHYYTIRTGHDLGHRSYDALTRLAAGMRGGWADGHLVVASSSAGHPLAN